MAMAAGGKGGIKSDINVTPLVDVVLVLLIIFMVVVPLLLKGYDVGIPKATAQTLPTEADSSQVVLNIKSDACPVFERLTARGLPAECRVALDEQLAFAQAERFGVAEPARDARVSEQSVDGRRIIGAQRTDVEHAVSL